MRIYVRSLIQSFVPLLIGIAIGYFAFQFLFVVTEDNEADLKLNYQRIALAKRIIPISNEGRFKNIKILDKKTSKILCIVIVSPTSYTTSVAGIASTWGQKCSGLKFITTKEPAFSEWSKNRTIVIEQWFSSRVSWSLVRNIWKLVYKEWLNDYNWFLLVEENSFIVLENLALLLSYKNFSEPKYYGHLLKKDGFKYISSDPGYVLSQEAVRKLGQQLSDTDSPWIDMTYCARSRHSMSEISWVMGKCLESVNVEPIDTRDSEGRLMFLPLPITHLMNFQNRRIMRNVHNLIEISDKKFEPGFNCCSDVAIAFLESKGYKIKTNKIHMNYMVYRLRPRRRK